jgi:hypothetical protein
MTMTMSTHLSPIMAIVIGILILIFHHHTLFFY